MLSAVGWAENEKDGVEKAAQQGNERVQRLIGS
jgi:hypothetical protein